MKIDVLIELYNEVAEIQMNVKENIKGLAPLKRIIRENISFCRMHKVEPRLIELLYKERLRDLTRLGIQSYIKGRRK